MLALFVWVLLAFTAAAMIAMPGIVWLLAADFAVLLEPTDGTIEGGCKGTLRVDVTTKGVAAHSARPWKGHNAIHDAAQVLPAVERERRRPPVLAG